MIAFIQEFLFLQDIIVLCILLSSHFASSGSFASSELGQCIKTHLFRSFYPFSKAILTALLSAKLNLYRNPHRSFYASPTRTLHGTQKKKSLRENLNQARAGRYKSVSYSKQVNFINGIIYLSTFTLKADNRRWCSVLVTNRKQLIIPDRLPAPASIKERTQSMGVIS